MRRLGAPQGIGVLPTVGSKELVALLPSLLGIGRGETVALPSLAYPTYAVGALLAGATPVTYTSLVELGPARVRLLWVNSPANPTGQVLPAEHLREDRRLGPRAGDHRRQRRVLLRARLGRGAGQHP